MKLDRKTIDMILWIFIAVILGIIVMVFLVPCAFFYWALVGSSLLMVAFILIFDRCPHCRKHLGGRFRSGQYCPFCGNQL